MRNAQTLESLLIMKVYLRGVEQFYYYIIKNNNNCQTFNFGHLGAGTLFHIGCLVVKNM